MVTGWYELFSCIAAGLGRAGERVCIFGEPLPDNDAAAGGVTALRLTRTDGTRSVFRLQQ